MLFGIKIQVTVILIVTIICTFVMPVNAAIQIPAELKVGLFYGSKAVSSINVSAKNGIEIGNYSNNSFVTLHEIAGNGILQVKKDSYYHIRIGNFMEDYSVAKSFEDLYEANGLSCYIVYTGQWHIYSGYFASQTDAAAGIDEITNKIGYQDTAIISPLNYAVTISSGEDTIMMYAAATGTLRLRPGKQNNPAVLKVKDTNYRGQIEVKRLSGSDMTVINVLKPDQYLYGVVPREIGAGSPAEALKAQAVAARTYTLANIGKHEKFEFDVCDTTDCQAYGGFDFEAAASNKAVDDTIGKKVLYNGRLASTFYFNSSGGRTEDVENVWGTPVPYLKSVEDKYESVNSYRYNWELIITSDKIRQLLSGKGVNIGTINGISKTRMSNTGRTTELVFYGSSGSKAYVRESTRTVLGLYSQLYNISTDCDVYAGTKPEKMQLAGKKVITASGVTVLGSNQSTASILGANQDKRQVPFKPSQFKFNGKGWGHGVGMSQEGAKGMALNGFTYEQILKHYYTGTTVE